MKKSSAQITDHVRFESIYEQDRLIPVLPDSTLSMESVESGRAMRVYREIAIGWFESNCFAYFEESAKKNNLTTAVT